MAEEKAGEAKVSKVAKQVKSRTPEPLESKIAKLEEQAKLLRVKLRERQRKQREENAKAIAALLSTEELDVVSVDVWTAALPSIKAALDKAKPAEKVAD